MGNRRLRCVAFFAVHPHCCFCAGAALATTEDHVPSKAFFNGRDWPAGFSFPACERCNHATAKVEQLAAWICRTGKQDATDDEVASSVALMQGVENNFPGLLATMPLRAIEIRRWLREKGLALNPGETTADLPIVSLTDERIHSAMKDFGRKLLLALFYHHTKTIFPRDGSFAFRWFSNATFEHIHPIVGQITPGLVVPSRANTSMGDQFFYRYGLTENPQATAFIAFFHASAAILGVMFPADPGIELPSQFGAVLRPFAWP